MAVALAVAAATTFSAIFGQCVANTRGERDVHAALERCTAEVERAHVRAVNADQQVIEAEERAMRAEARADRIVLQHLTEADDAR